jgi:hypothetical protein
MALALRRSAGQKRMGGIEQLRCRGCDYILGIRLL